MNRKCSSLQKNEAVVFNMPNEIYGGKKTEEWGNVSYVDTKRRTVSISYLEGYRSRSYDCPFEDMLAVSNPAGEMMKFGCISGHSDRLIPE